MCRFDFKDLVLSVFKSNVSTFSLFSLILDTERICQYFQQSSNFTMLELYTLLSETFPWNLEARRSWSHWLAAPHLETTLKNPVSSAATESDWEESQQCPPSLMLVSLGPGEHSFLSHDLTAFCSRSLKSCFVGRLLKHTDAHIHMRAHTHTHFIISFNQLGKFHKIFLSLIPLGRTH